MGLARSARRPPVLQGGNPVAAGRTVETKNRSGASPGPDCPETRQRRAERLGHRPDDFVLRREDAAGLSGPTESAGLALLPRTEAPVVQRAVGFEFETGWLVYGRQMPLPHLRGRPPNPDLDPKPLKKKDLVTAMGGFKVEADEAGGGLSELEFIVHPPVPATESAESQLDFTMSYMEIFGSDLLGLGKTKSFFGLDEITGQRLDARFLIKKGDDELKAGPQVTSGVSLEKIPEIGTKKGIPEGFKRSVMTIRSITSGIDEAKLEGLAPEGGLSPQLRGLVSYLVSLLWGGESGGLEYPKQIADVFLLGRTDTPTMFRLLPGEEKDFYSSGKGPWRFIDLVLTAAQLEGQGDLPVIVKGIRPSFDAPYQAIGPSRAKWLFFLTQGFDLLSSEVDEQFESLGELRAKTEPVGPEEKEAPIFEFRGAQTGKIPLKDWKPFALDTFRFLLDLEKD